MNIKIKDNEIQIDMGGDILVHASNEPMFTTDKDHVIKFVGKESNVVNVEPFYTVAIMKYLKGKKRVSKGEL